MTMGSFFLFLLHSSLLASTRSSPSFPDKGDDLIRATCHRTNDFNLCVSTLKSDPRSLNADVKALAGITLEIVLTKANGTLQAVTNLFKNTQDPLLVRVYGDCIEDYKRAVTTSLPEAISALKANNYGASKQGAKDAATSAQMCETEFGVKTAVSGQNKLIQDLSLVASSIISILS